MIKNTNRKIVSTVVVVIVAAIFGLLAWTYFMLFKKAMSFITVLLFFNLIYIMIQEKKYLNASRLALLFFICISLFEPLIQYQKILLGTNKEKKAFEFYYEEGNMEFISFIYKQKKYDSKSTRYFLVGNTSNYIFLFDGQRNKTLVFAKDDCENIESEVFYLNK